MAKSSKKYYIIGQRPYGLYAGFVTKRENQPDGSMTIEVEACRHVRYWYGKSGGITSLAAFGICGPRAKESRIGAAVNTVLANVISLYECSPEAQASIEAAVQS